MQLGKALRIAEKAKDDLAYRRENPDKVKEAEDVKYEFVKSMFPNVTRIGYGQSTKEVS